MKQMTYVEAVNYAIENLDNETVVARLSALRDSLVKRNSADRKPTKTQVANEGIKADILAYLADGEKHTVTEIMENVASLAGASNQKAATLVTALVKAELVNREEIKRKAYFSLA